jgi:hypothetical protein
VQENPPREPRGRKRIGAADVERVRSMMDIHRPALPDRWPHP